jgi:hypothetical protein
MREVLTPPALKVQNLAAPKKKLTNPKALLTKHKFLEPAAVQCSPFPDPISTTHPHFHPTKSYQ